MNIDKSDLSTKKMRKKMMKKVRNQLYSNFVRSGTLTGGKMEEAAAEEMETVKDMSKIKELSDDQLVAACGGLTAHKGARHGLNMKAKLDRIAEAEAEFMAKFGGASNTADDVDASAVKKHKKKKKNKESKEIEEDIKLANESIKKRKRSHDTEVHEEIVEKKKKKKKKHKKDVL